VAATRPEAGFAKKIKKIILNNSSFLILRDPHGFCLVFQELFGNLS